MREAKRTSWIDSNSVISVGASLSLRLPLCVSLGFAVEAPILARTGPDGRLDVREEGVHAGLR